MVFTMLMSDGEKEDNSLGFGIFWDTLLVLSDAFRFIGKLQLITRRLLHWLANMESRALRFG